MDCGDLHYVKLYSGFNLSILINRQMLDLRTLLKYLLAIVIGS